MENKLKEWACKYEVKEHILNDPIQFPHRYSNKQDIEISAFITSWISYGNRKAIIAKAEEIDRIFGQSPYLFILNGDFEQWKDCKKNLYRFYNYADLYDLCIRLHEIYSNYADMEECLSANALSCPIQKLQYTFVNIKGIPLLNGKSACKRLAMFLRWMVRRDSVVDFGIWQNTDPRNLVIPLDTHVYKQALELKITNRKTPDMIAAREITDYFKSIYPEDPAKGDFALFGYGVNNK